MKDCKGECRSLIFGQLARPYKLCDINDAGKFCDKFLSDVQIEARDVCESRCDTFKESHC